jgi:hypothetical protein
MNYGRSYCVIQSVKDVMLPCTARDIYFAHFIPTGGMVCFFGLVILKVKVFLNYRRELYE